MSLKKLGLSEGVPKKGKAVDVFQMFLNLLNSVFCNLVISIKRIDR